MALWKKKIIKILELVQIKEDGTVELPEESKKLIHEVAEECRKLPIYKDKAGDYKDEMTAEKIYLDMCLKISCAPTWLHAIMAPKLLLPVIDDLLQEEAKSVCRR